jgi:hypothetical protein
MSYRSGKTPQTDNVGDFIGGLLWILACLAAFAWLIWEWDWFDWLSVW